VPSVVGLFFASPQIPGCDSATPGKIQPAKAASGFTDCHLYTDFRQSVGIEDRKIVARLGRWWTRWWVGGHNLRLHNTTVVLCSLRSHLTGKRFMFFF
jgi:hypothetical protein